MDMKRILQALDGDTSSRSVEGQQDMKRYMDIINSNDVHVIKEEVDNNQLLTEGSDPHKVSLPVRMTMQHYQSNPAAVKDHSTGLLHKYLSDIETQAKDQADADMALREQRKRMYGKKIANKVLMKESKGLSEAPIQMNPEDPMNPLVHGHRGVNSAHLKTRMIRAADLIKDLASRVDTTDAVTWENIVKQFREVALNVEQIRHGLDELAQVKSQGGTKSQGIDPNIGLEESSMSPGISLIGISVVSLMLDDSAEIVQELKQRMHWNSELDKRFGPFSLDTLRSIMQRLGFRLRIFKNRIVLLNTATSSSMPMPLEAFPKKIQDILRQKEIAVMESRKNNAE